jgi:hypothetical protein
MCELYEGKKRLRVPEKRVLWRIPGHKREEVTQG